MHIVLGIVCLYLIFSLKMIPLADYDLTVSLYLVDHGLVLIRRVRALCM